MNIGLKNVKIHPDMSQETNCFSAAILVDGKTVGNVHNSGTGGSNIYYFDDKDAEKRLHAYAASVVTEFNFEQLDIVVDRLLQRHETLRFLKRHTKKKTMFKLKGAPVDSWMEIAMPYNPDIKKYLTAKYGDKLEVIANENLEAAAAIGADQA